MNRHQRRWLHFMLGRPARKPILFPPYWAIRIPIYLYALVRHALQQRADRLVNVGTVKRK